MKRLAMLVFLVAAAATTTARAQNWAEKMFPDGVAHDFGVVPHGAQLFHRFNIKNIYGVRMAGKNMAKRVSFLIGLDGKIVHVTNSGNPDVHLTEMKAAIAGLKS